MSSHNAPTTNTLLKPALLFSCIVLALTLQSGFIFLLIAILPSISAYFIDEDNDKSTFKVVVLCNLAATLHYLLPMIFAAVKMERYDVIETATNLQVWLVIYGGAAMGWCLVFFFSIIARYFIMLYFEYRLQSLENLQKKLIAEWGDRVIDLV